MPRSGWKDPDAERRIAAVEAALEPLLPALVARAEHDSRPVVTPVFHRGEAETRQLSAVFTNLVAGVETVRSVAEQHGVQIHVGISECAGGSHDPLAHLRPMTVLWGTSHVILWSLGQDRSAP